MTFMFDIKKNSKQTQYNVFIRLFFELNLISRPKVIIKLQSCSVFLKTRNVNPKKTLADL